MDTTTPSHQIMVSYISPPDWYKEAYLIFNYIVCSLQFFGFAINIIHLSVLSRKQLRDNLIYRLMIGICCCDLLTQVNTFLMFSPYLVRYPKKEEECYLTHNYFDAFLYLHGTTVLDVTQRAASWMALFMALFRTLSVLFPMSGKIQKICKPITAIWTVLGVLVGTSLTTWMVQYLRIIKPYDWDYDCDGNEIHLNGTRYGVLIPNEFDDIQKRLVSLYGFIKALPSLIDPVLTVLLVLELRKAAKRRKNCGKCEDAEKEKNTTKLIIFVTISFFFLEVPNGFAHIVSGFARGNVPLRTLSVMIPTFAEILPVVNSSSHFFICYLMSSQYRETAVGIYGCIRLNRKGSLKDDECWATRTH